MANRVDAYEKETVLLVDLIAHDNRGQIPFRILVFAQMVFVTT